MGSSQALNDAAVVICTHDLARWERLESCVRSIETGSLRPASIVLVVDSNPELYERARLHFDGRAQVVLSSTQGLSFARNMGVSVCQEEFVAFIDDDARADRQWLEHMLGSLRRHPGVVGVTGRVLPEWEAEDSRLPEALWWIVGCTYSGHRTDRGPVRNPLGCAMAFRRDAVLEVGGFPVDFGRHGNFSGTGEDTAMGLEIGRHRGPGAIWYEPLATVWHAVPKARTEWRYVLRRCAMEGRAKARLSLIYGKPAMAPEARYSIGLLVSPVRGTEQRWRQFTYSSLTKSMFALLVTAVSFVTEYLIRRFTALLRR